MGQGLQVQITKNGFRYLCRKPFLYYIFFYYCFFPGFLRMYTVEIFNVYILCVTYPQGICRQISKPPALRILPRVLWDKHTPVNRFRNIGIFNAHIFKGDIFNPFNPALLTISRNNNGQFNTRCPNVLNDNIAYSAFSVKKLFCQLALSYSQVLAEKQCIKLIRSSPSFFAIINPRLKLMPIYYTKKTSQSKYCLLCPIRCIIKLQGNLTLLIRRMIL